MIACCGGCAAERPCDPDHGRQTALLDEGDFAMFVGDETAHDPQPKAAADRRALVSRPEEVFGALVGQSRPLVADVDDERRVRRARLQANDAARRRCGAGVDQQIERGLANAFAGDGKRSSNFVDPGEPDVLARSFRLDEQAQVIEVDRPRRMLRVSAPVVDEISNGQRCECGSGRVAAGSASHGARSRRRRAGATCRAR